LCGLAAAGLAGTLVPATIPHAIAGVPDAATPAVDTRPLHARIDEVLARGIATSLPDRCSDETFIRRASLDFRGFMPTAEEVRAFAAEPASDKRARLVDAFIADPQHARHLATVLDVMLMERRAEKHVKPAEWRAWLREQAAARTPWDALVRSLLAADGSEGTPRGAARWLLDREAEPNALARDTARLFLGMDLSCAQCHDHPRIADYWQRDYQGLLAFFSRTYLFQPDPMKPAVVAERAEGEASFVSVFTKISGQEKPRLPGEAAIVEPVVAPAEAWVVAPNEKDKTVRPVPRHSRRAGLADPLTTSRAFALNAANRFWATLLGRGVIEPVDLRHTANPPAADALLEILADGLVALKFDISAFWREVALSRAYQAPYDAPAGPPATATEAAALQATAEAATTAEQESRRRETAAREAWEPLQLAAQAVDTEAAAAAKAVADARGPADTAAAALAQARTALAAKADLLPALQAAAAQCTQAAQVVTDAPELAQAAALMQARLSAAQSEHDSLAKDLAAKEADHAAKAAALAAATENAAAITPRQTEARAAAESAWTTVAELASTARNARDTARRATRDAARAAALAAVETATRQREDARRRLSIAEQAAQSVAAASVSAQAVCAKLPEDKELAAVLVSLQARQATATTAVQSARQEVDAAETSVITATESMVPRWTEGFALAALTPLTPEQLCWSVLRTTGVLDQLRAQSAREWDEKNPAPADPAAAQDPARTAARSTAIEALTEEKVRPHEDQFVRLFGNGAGSPQTDFFATSDQALYFENAGVLRSWTQPGGANLAERLAGISDPAALAHELFLSVLSRPPSPEETAQILSHFSTHPADQKPAALSDALWALLTSAEYRFKH
jgi:hypothetical protein